MPPVSKGRRLNITSDARTDAILSRVPNGDRSQYIRDAIAEKAMRDEHRAELDEIRERLARIERKLGLKP